MTRLPAFAAIILLFSTTANALGQEINYASEILGTWMTIESLATSEIEAPEFSSYSRFEFGSDNKVYMGTNEYERGVKVSYRIAGNTLLMFGNSYTIEKLADGRLDLILHAKWGGVDVPLTFVSKDIYDAQWRFTPGRKKPLFNGGVPLFEYVFSHYVKDMDDFKKQSLDKMYAREPHPPVNDKVIKIDLTIDSAGNVIVHDIVGSPRMGKLRRRRITEKLENTSGMWVAGHVDNRKVSQRLTMNFVKRGNPSLKFRNRALGHFRRSYESMLKEEYADAVRQASEAISLVDDKYQFFLLRAVCYLKLDQVDKYCEDVRKANTLNPFVALRNFETIEGQQLQIDCGSN